ncbi:MAG: nitroreductase family protein [Flavobacteriaceae bacterium]|nr:nitroreductase family protein [Flavobacteriaceae bacterium]
MEKTVSEAIAYRRSVRVYKDIPIETEKVKQCIKNAVLAPNSSNLQLWEFYHVTNKETLKRLAVACFEQNAAKTAQQLVIIVARKDLWRNRVKANLNYINETYNQPNLSEKDKNRKNMATNYYKKIIPIAYVEFLGILGILKYVVFHIIGLFRPIYREVRNSDMRIVAHKSAGLAAQNFMLSMAAIGYDTCPLEGSDTLRIKKILKLPRGAEITMVIGCGIRDDKGIYGSRFRVPFDEVYTLINTTK